jgi:dTDP-glucose 4,6-dehydratase
VDNLTLVETLCAILDERRPGASPHADLIEFVTDRPGHDRRYAVDTAKIAGLGWAPRQSLRTGLETTVDWYLANPDWVGAVLHRTDPAT